jgi:hypothetical protein
VAWEGYHGEDTWTWRSLKDISRDAGGEAFKIFSDYFTSVMLIRKNSRNAYWSRLAGSKNTKAKRRLTKEDLEHSSRGRFSYAKKKNLFDPHSKEADLEKLFHRHVQN